jgi:hypothetical protein
VDESGDREGSEETEEKGLVSDLMTMIDAAATK